MIRNIEIDIRSKEDFIEKYNEKKISRELIEYIIQEAREISEGDKIKIIINKKCELEQNCEQMIIEGLKEEYNRSLKVRRRNNEKQIGLLILGIAFLFLARLVDEGNIWKEILLITGWVPIWEMIEVQLFPDMEGRKKRRIIDRILRSEITERNAIQKIIK